MLQFDSSFLCAVAVATVVPFCVPLSQKVSFTSRQGKMDEKQEVEREKRWLVDTMCWCSICDSREHTEKVFRTTSTITLAFAYRFQAFQRVCSSRNLLFIAQFADFSLSSTSFFLLIFSYYSLLSFFLRHTISSFFHHTTTTTPPASSRAPSTCPSTTSASLWATSRRAPRSTTKGSFLGLCPPNLRPRGNEQQR